MNNEDRQENKEERLLNSRKVTVEQKETKMSHLCLLANMGLRVIRMIEHDKYEVKGREHYYNPYTNVWGDPVFESVFEVKTCI